MYFIGATLMLFATWIVMSGKIFTSDGHLDLFHLGLGAISSVVVAWSSHDLLFQDRSTGFASRLQMSFRFVGYVFWLMGQIIMANFHVMALVLHPNMYRRIRPHIIRFPTALKSEFARFVFANSITLTPGTITIRIEGDEFIVHCINDRASAGLPRDMEKRIQRVFGEI